MRSRVIVSLILIMAVALLFGCGKDGAPGERGPAGPPGTPQPIKILIEGTRFQDSQLRDIAIFYNKEGYFPIGSTINYVNVTDSVPPLSFLKQYDAILLFNGYIFHNSEALGNDLADYVDAGGGLVIAQASFSGNWTIQGKIMTSGYSPFLANPSANVDADRTIDPSTIDFPLHPIFNGTDINNLVYWSNYQISYPTLASGATSLAKNVAGYEAIAINAKGNIIALDMYPPLNATSTYEDTNKLIANALLYVAKAF